MKQLDQDQYDVVLVDFGLARQQLMTQQKVTVGGTWPYCSPELQGESNKVTLSGKVFLFFFHPLLHFFSPYLFVFFNYY